MARFLAVFPVLAGLLAGTAVPAAAESVRANDRINGSDHEAARSGVKGGKLLPFREIVERVARRYPGQLLDASLHELVPGEPVYRVLWLRPDNRRLAIWVDARSGEILRVEGA